MKSIKNMSYAELLDAQRQIEDALDGAKAKELASVKEQAEKIIREAGFSPKEILSTKKMRAKPRATKYRHPTDPTKTWSGLGRKPKWFAEMEAAKEAAE